MTLLGDFIRLLMGTSKKIVQSVKTNRHGTKWNSGLKVSHVHFNEVRRTYPVVLDGCSFYGVLIFRFYSCVKRFIGSKCHGNVSIQEF